MVITTIATKVNFLKICDALRDLVPFVQLKNMKNTHGRVTFIKFAG